MQREAHAGESISVRRTRAQGGGGGRRRREAPHPPHSEKDVEVAHHPRVRVVALVLGSVVVLVDVCELLDLGRRQRRVRYALRKKCLVGVGEIGTRPLVRESAREGERGRGGTHRLGPRGAKEAVWVVWARLA